jgi:hypothetical protein
MSTPLRTGGATAPEHGALHEKRPRPEVRTGASSWSRTGAGPEPPRRRYQPMMSFSVAEGRITEAVLSASPW